MAYAGTRRPARDLLFETLKAALPHPVLRNVEEPLEEPRSPYTVLREGEADAVDELCGDEGTFFEDPITVTFYCPTKSRRGQLYDAEEWLSLVDDAAGGRRLGAPVDFAHVRPPLDEEERRLGMSPFASARIIVQLDYFSPKSYG